MNINNFKIGDRVLLQSSSAVKEVVVFKAIMPLSGYALLKKSDGYIGAYDPKFILKNFGQP